MDDTLKMIATAIGGLGAGAAGLKYGPKAYKSLTKPKKWYSRFLKKPPTNYEKYVEPQVRKVKEYVDKKKKAVDLIVKAKKYDYEANKALKQLNKSVKLNEEARNLNKNSRQALRNLMGTEDGANALYKAKQSKIDKALKELSTMDRRFEYSTLY